MTPDLAPLPGTFYQRDAVEVAADLIGRLLVRRRGRALMAGRIVETEAYRRDDPASHSYRGLTRRNRSMFGPPGHAYVYVSYGIHHCMNVVTAPVSAVLVRALEPVLGLGHMARHRGLDGERVLCAGPGRLCQALAIDRADDGTDLTTARGVWVAAGAPAAEVVSTPRIGISTAVELP
ncbi:MAG: DNA-3-methyladenine glycosylase, partial [Actinomycetota bacterium]|nr:DNA-3-methyladenine glycosylase [Actinomycetota bacterium]